mmetsp:Transcript_5236/g.14055  ORF Transcript_5236/g.14055 Transcript_5236/m.14055 type:complete len:363 (+) Transcript_5236:104-1192(+)
MVGTEAAGTGTPSGLKTIEQIELDGLVIMKIIKHCQETYPITVTGQLLGMDVDEILEVTNCYPFPQSTPSAQYTSGNAFLDQDLDPQVDHSQFQMDMMRCVREVNIDHQVVGWYQSTGAQVGSFLTPQWLETQAAYQANLSAVVCLVYDPIRTVEGSLNLRAYRISPRFMALYSKGQFSSVAFAKHGVSTKNMVEELPIRVRNAAVINAMVSSLELDPQILGENDVAFARLDESSMPVVEQTLDYILGDMDELTRDQSRYTFFVRNLVRSAGPQLEALRRSRSAAGNGEPASDPSAALNDPALARLFTNEPPRLETKLILRDLQSYMDSIDMLSHNGLLRTSAVEAVQALDDIEVSEDSHGM